MATPDYFVQSSIARDDTATWEDREDGSQPLAVTITRENDGSDDAVHAAHLTIDLDVTDDLPVTINQNGTQLYAVDLASVEEAIEQATEEVGDWRGSLDLVLGMVRAARNGVR